MSSLISKYSIFVVSQILYCIDDSLLVQVARVFNFNDFGSYLSRIILNSLFPVVSFVIILIIQSAKSKQVSNSKVLILILLIKVIPSILMAFLSLISKTESNPVSKLSSSICMFFNSLAESVFFVSLYKMNDLVQIKMIEKQWNHTFPKTVGKLISGRVLDPTSSRLISFLSACTHNKTRWKIVKNVNHLTDLNIFSCCLTILLQKATRI